MLKKKITVKTCVGNIGIPSESLENVILQTF